MSDRGRAVVIGGGVSGIAAALALSKVGHQVTLVERKKTLGGRAYSFTDRTTNDTIDNGQHVLLGCCTHAIAFFEELKTADDIRWHDRFHYLTPDGERHDLAPTSWLPAPLHYGPGLMAWSALGFADRLRIARAFTTLMASSARRRKAWGTQTFETWLKARGQSPKAIRRFWNPIVESAVNENCERAAAGPALKVFLEAFLSSHQGTRMGVFERGLSEMIDGPTEALLTGRGGQVKRRSLARRLINEGSQLQAIELGSGERLEADHFVFALPYRSLCALASGEAPGTRPRGGEHENSGIVGIHLWFDRPVTDLPHGALLDSPIHWFFNKERRDDGQKLALIVSASHDLTLLSQAEIIALACRELEAVLPKARSATLVHAVVVKENRATFSATPEFESQRPGPLTRFKNAAMAGDWTQSGWPSTIEGSIRSGYAAATSLVAECNSAHHADLAPSWLARILVRP